MQRVLAWCLRAVAFFKARTGRITRSATHSLPRGSLTTEELQKSETFLIRWEQSEHFQPIITAVQRGTLDRHPKYKFIRRLRPFLDDDGVLRVGGRLENSSEPYDAQHPKILPKGILAEVIARHFHVTLLHAGPQLLLASIRQIYWPMGGRGLTRKVVRMCIPCFRAKPPIQEQLMANLPEHRVTCLRPFQPTGTDFAGPLLLKSGQRKVSARKSYIAVMVCLSTKAIHLELVSSLSTEAYIATLRRFVARRGIPAFMYSDNGTTFVGTDNELKKLLKSTQFNEDVGNFMSSMEIKWCFQPPKAPHHGGLWEAVVKSCKYHLKRVVGLTPLNFEEMSTVLAQIEAILNSRPLVQLSTDAADPTSLTPGHFLTGSALNQLPDPNLQDLSISRLDRWQLCQKLQKDFARRWKQEYLCSLQARTKWSKESVNLKKEDVVLFLDDQLPSTLWPLGIVTDTFPGQDGKIRVITVKTSRGQYRRPITKVVKLPLKEEHEEE
ncbi:uncharacterized protein LOC129808557 [Phlebotomus papatasi]|uniref:uncharacterized protein LOC129808557 n=1 Tax=Phlebotomus papatasi TaxID=29031 RepID=UPI002483A5A8|nr:uncharacterized protein LOC129808557 [Phlebotomus papatasi]